MSRLARSDVLFLAAVAAGVVLGVWLNPFLTTWLDRELWTLGIVTLTAVAAISNEIVRSLRRNPSIEAPVPNEPLAYSSVIGFWLAMVAWSVLYRFPWTTYHFYADDFRYFAESGYSWSEAKGNLFTPFNEHLVPITRLVTFLINSGNDAFGSEHRLPILCGAFCAWLFVCTCGLFFLLLHRIGGNLAALIGVAVFAVSLCHSEIVNWYSAAQWLIPVCFLISSLLLVERDSKTRLALATVFSAIGPWNFTLGAVVGPFTAIWLLGWHRRLRWSSLIPAAVGIASTAVVMVIVRQSMHDERYWQSGGRGMAETFSPAMGMIYSTRLFVDRLILTNLGYRGPFVSMTTAAFIVAAVGVLIVWMLRRKPELARLWPMAAFIVLGYAVAIPFRTWQSYDWLVDWNRYQLLPHLGLAMLVAGIVGSSPRWRHAGGWQTIGIFAVGLVLWTLLQDFGWMNPVRGR